MSIVNLLDMIPPDQCVRIFNAVHIKVLYEGQASEAENVTGNVVAVYADNNVLVIGVW